MEEFTVYILNKETNNEIGTIKSDATGFNLMTMKSVRPLLVPPKLV